jgi:uncharacterized protein with GYD domain
MLNVRDDRVSTVSALLEYFGGKFESMYWDVEESAAHVTCDMPDSYAAAAAVTAATKTGGFKSVDLRLLLTQDELYDVVTLAKSSEGLFHAPGAVPDEDI